MNIYNPKKIEQKWQKRWKKEGLYEAKDFAKDKEKFYHLVMFPYPSGDLHMGHWYNYAGADVVARKKLRDGCNVMSPIGFDAFGLPAENAAIKRGIHPKTWTYSNIETMRKQLYSTGAMFDYSREVITSDPEYYRWTQWIFLKMYERGLAYRKKAPANWCPKDQTVLANEQVVDGKCERCGTEVVQKEIDQWLFKITDYAEKLLNDLEKLDWPEKTKTMQKNWIGRSEGALIKFKISAKGGSASGGKSEKLEVEEEFVEVFTTRADTLFGATYLVLAPEHELVKNQVLSIKNKEEVEKYVERARKKTELERLSEDKDKTGVELKGIKAVNPANEEEIPVWISDYVLGSYGTGAIMAVPAHDARDYEFAKKFGLPIKEVVASFHHETQGKDAVRNDKPTTKRKAVIAIIKHWEKDEVFCLDWEKFGWKSFVIGGVDKSESGEEAAKRETMEESGYTDIKNIKKIGGAFYNFFYAAHKNENRYAELECYYIELGSGEYLKPKEEDVIHHKGEWIAISKVSSYLTLIQHQWYWNVFQRGEKAFVDDGILIDSGEFSGLTSEQAREKIVEWLAERGLAKKKVQYKLRDWLISRQRYWGVPIPIIHCEHCGIVPVKESDLPVELPEVENYLPKEGQSPLARSEEFVNAKCPNCGKDAKRETDTMDTFVCSSWYFFRYADPKNKKEFAARKNLNYWMKPNGVDLYVGGAEHTVLHLLYSRFFTKVLYDAGLTPVGEPFGKMRHQGIILGPDGQKMSKSKGNVVDPDELVKDFGADAVRMYLLFMGPYELGGPWNPRGLVGIRRFLDRVWKLADGAWQMARGNDGEFEVLRNKTIKKVTEDIEGLRFHTAIASMMEYLNALENKGASKNDAEILTHLLSPFAPHFAEEIWQEIWKNKKSIFKEPWPEFDPKKIQEENISIVVQFNGKTRGMITVYRGIAQEEAEKLVAEDEKLKKYLPAGEAGLTGKPKKVIFIKDKLINFVL